MQNIVVKIMHLYDGVTDDVILKLYERTTQIFKLNADDQVFKIQNIVKVAVKTTDIRVADKLTEVLCVNIMRHFSRVNPNWDTWSRLYRGEFLPVLKAARNEQAAKEQETEKFFPVVLNFSRQELVYAKDRKLVEQHGDDAQVLTQQKFR